ncbi:unnamed protein product [Didymodactylos carnosus]|uniref:Uncharacterized protein n=1 Tax=Didymodactylos carnosus TaxID=1234261 RepID=A0A814T4V0_9BILA|nr:unnamed protein product [Didymodactylos carnosus]CAF3919976.1 unnamed protein product [Didymodactylos carnosus]
MVMSMIVSRLYLTLFYSLWMLGLVFRYTPKYQDFILRIIIDSLLFFVILCFMFAVWNDEANFQEILLLMSIGFIMLALLSSIILIILYGFMNITAEIFPLKHQAFKHNAFRVGLFVGTGLLHILAAFATFRLHYYVKRQTNIQIE